MSEEEKRRLTAKEAAEVAAKYLAELRTDMNRLDISLEEIELTSDEKYWLITLGHPRSYLGTAKDYKVIKVDIETGEVLSMKMKNICICE